MKITDRILEAFSLIWTSGVWPHTPNEIIKILLYAHSKGWLYMVTKEEKVVGMAIAYRVEKIEEVDAKFPLTESGRILFIPLAVAREGSKMYCLRRFTGWINSHQADFDEVVFERNDHLVRKPIGGNNGEKKQGRGVTGSPEVLSEQECQLQH